jgi:hypothetical protein
MCVQREVGIAWNRKIVYRQGIQHLSGLYLRRRSALRTEFGEAVGDIEDEDDKRPVCGSLDLKIAEERIGAEKVQRLIDNVVLRWFAW